MHHSLGTTLQPDTSMPIQHSLTTSTIDTDILDDSPIPLIPSQPLPHLPAP
jgi:hypothetical protein